MSSGERDVWRSARSRSMHDEAGAALQLATRFISPVESTRVMTTELARQIAALRRSRKFVGYRESFTLARELRELLTTLRERILPDLPARAFELADAFIRADSRVFERLDDSAGIVGDAFRDACLLWLDAAAQSRKDEDWVERIHALTADNDYGVRDPLLPHAARLLSEHELRRLARRYEEEGKRSGSREAANGSWINLGEVARALRDPSLLERAGLARGYALSDRHQLEIARHCVEWGQIDEALTRLESIADGDYSRDCLLFDCYEKKGNRDVQVRLLWRLFEAVPDIEHLARLLALVPEAEQVATRSRAREISVRNSRTTDAIEFLLRAGWEDDAERIAIERRSDLDGHHYPTLLELAKLAVSAGRPRVEVVCYRNLLRCILEDGRSKAYGHAAKYFKRLVRLDDAITDYHPLPDHTQFVQELRRDHGRKSAFWGRVERRE